MSDKSNPIRNGILDNTWTIQGRNDLIVGSSHSLWYLFAILFLIVDYGRPQDIIPIGAIRPAMIVIIILSLYLILNQSVFIISGKQIRYIWFFIILLALHVPFARNNYFAYITTREMLKFMPFIISITILVNSMDRLKQVIFICCILVTYVSIYSLTHGGLGSGNYFKDENDLSLYINSFIPFSYFLFLYEKTKWKKIFYGLSLVVGIIAVVNSMSRGGYVGLIAIGAAIWLLSSRKFLSALALVVCSMLIMSYGGELYKREMATVTDIEGSTAKERIESWKSSLNMFIANPFGVGGNNFQVRFPEYQTDYFKRGMWGRVAHSLWFTLLAELGIFGVILYFLLLKYNIRDLLFLKNISIRGDPDLEYLRVLSLAMLASFAGFFTSGTFLSVLYYPHYWYLTAVIIAMVNIANNKIDQLQTS